MQHCVWYKQVVSRQKTAKIVPFEQFTLYFQEQGGVVGEKHYVRDQIEHLGNKVQALTQTMEDLKEI